MTFSAITKLEGNKTLVREQEEKLKGIEEFMIIDRK